MKNINKIMALLSAAVMAVPFCGCSEDEESSDSAGIIYYNSENSYVDSVAEMDSAEKEMRDNAQTYPGAVGEKVSVGNCESTIKKVVFIGKRDADNMHTEPANMYAALIEVTNNTDETVVVSSLNNFMVSVDGGNVVLGLDAATAIYAKRKYDLDDLDAEAEPGQTVSGYVTFTTPLEWNELTLEYAPGTGENVYDRAVYTVTQDNIEEP